MSDRGQPAAAASPGARPRTVRERLPGLVPAIWALALTVLLLGPALGPGYVLTHDMVWVPDLALDRAVLGLGSALPRAVPSDGVVAALDEVLGGMVLQKCVLIGALVGAGAGAAALVGGRLPRRLLAVSVTVWNPFVVERLWMGHWPILLGYAAVPWLVMLGRRTRASGRISGALLLMLAVGSLSANAGIVSALTVLLTGARGRRTTQRLVVACLAANAPWIVAGLVHAGLAQDAGGYRLFATHGDGRPAPLAAMGLGGIWNADVVPGSQTGVLGWVWLVALLILGALGAAPWWRRTGRRLAGAQLALWLVGMGLAWLSWLVPGALAWVGQHVAGGGLFRDGSRSLALALPLILGTVCEGAQRLAGGVPVTAGRGALWVGLAALPLMVLPDAAWGIDGALRAVPYPADLLAARQAVGGESGTALLLPWAANRAPAWNGGRAVLDPLGRLLPVATVADDDLRVDGTTVRGEDPSARLATAALAQQNPAARAKSLRAMGVRWVVVQADTGSTQRSPQIAGTEVHAGPLVTVLRLPGVVARERPAGWRLPVVALGWAAYVALVVAGALRALRGCARKWRAGRRSGATVPANG